MLNCPTFGFITFLNAQCFSACNTVINRVMTAMAENWWRSHVCLLGCTFFDCFATHLLKRSSTCFIVIGATVLIINLPTPSACLSPPADRLVSVHGATAHGDWSSIYISWEDQSLYKGKTIDWHSEGGGLCGTQTHCTWSHRLGRCLEPHYQT